MYRDFHPPGSHPEGKSKQLPITQLYQSGLCFLSLSVSEIDLLEQVLHEDMSVNFPQVNPAVPNNLLEKSEAQDYYRSVYHRMLEHWISMGNDPRRLFIGTPFNQHILDLGCGTGQITKGLIQYLNHVSGVDLAPALVEKARIEGIEAAVCNIDDQLLPFNDGQFCVVYAFDILEHLYDLNHAFEETYRVLKNGGILKMTVPVLQPDTMRSNREFHGNTIRTLGIDEALANQEPEINILPLIEWIDLLTRHHFAVLTRAWGYEWNVTPLQLRSLLTGPPGNAPNVLLTAQKIPKHIIISGQVNRGVAAGAWSNVEMDYGFQRISPSLSLNVFLDNE